jgi:hypothetical protein
MAKFVNHKRGKPLMHCEAIPLSIAMSKALVETARCLERSIAALVSLLSALQLQPTGLVPPLTLLFSAIWQVS